MISSHETMADNKQTEEYDVGSGKPSESSQNGAESEKPENLKQDEELTDEVGRDLGDLLTTAMKLEEKDIVDHVLDDVSFEAVARFLKSDKCQNVITMAGAGISTSAGIPDFRSPGSGLYANLQQYNLPDPMAIFSIQYFLEHPEPFCKLSKELWPGHFKPTPCHYFLKLLHDKGKLLRHFTQNIDTLEHHTGLPAEKIVEAHGSFKTSHCLECRKEYTQEWVKDKIFSDKVPRCDNIECGGLVKPDIVFFGEALPKRFYECVKKDLKKCDLLIIMGTSLTVQPFASLPARVPRKTPRLYINLDAGTTQADPMMAFMMGSSSLDFDGENNHTDVFKQATCDDGCYELADRVGWGEELIDTVEKEHARLNAELAKEGLLKSRGSKV